MSDQYQKKEWKEHPPKNTGGYEIMVLGGHFTTWMRCRHELLKDGWWRRYNCETSESIYSCSDSGKELNEEEYCDMVGYDKLTDEQIARVCTFITANSIGADKKIDTMIAKKKICEKFGKRPNIVIGQENGKHIFMGMILNKNEEIVVFGTAQDHTKNLR